MHLVYDAGALVAAERNSSRLWNLHRRALHDRIEPVIPAAVLAQVWRGRASQANLSRLLRACEVRPDTEELARLAGTACGKADTSDVVDALVVVTACELRAPVITSDPDDLRRLANGLNMSVPLHHV